MEAIAEHFLGYEIEISDEGLFADPDYLGGIIFANNLIQVNASVESNEGRYNFTIAHEIGHHVLHRQAYLQASAENASNILCRDTNDKPLIEQQADRFAAALLMPQQAVSDAVSAIPRPSKLHDAQSCQRLCSYCGESRFDGKRLEYCNGQQAHRPGIPVGSPTSVVRPTTSHGERDPRSEDSLAAADAIQASHEVTV